MAQSAGVALAAFYQLPLWEETQGFLTHTLEYYENDTFIRDAWNKAMKDKDCCGVNGFKDFESNTSINALITADPDLKTICVTEEKPGCLELMRHFFYDQITPIVIIISATIGLKLSAIGFVSILSNSIGSKGDVEAEGDWQYQSHRIHT